MNNISQNLLSALHDPWRRRRPSASPGVICRQDWIPAGRNGFLSTAMHSCRQYVGHPHLSAGMGILPALPFPQATPGLAGGRRRRHGLTSDTESPSGIEGKSRHLGIETRNTRAATYLVLHLFKRFLVHARRISRGQPVGDNVTNVAHLYKHKRQ